MVRIGLSLADSCQPLTGQLFERPQPSASPAHAAILACSPRCEILGTIASPNWTAIYLSQIERGQIKRPDAKILWEVCELYLLDYARLAEWSGYLEHGTARDSAIVALALRILSKLEHKDQIEALRYLESLESRSRLAHHE